MSVNSDPSSSSNGPSEELTAQVLSDMLESSRVATLILDPGFRLMWANRASEVFLGARTSHMRRDLRQVLAGLKEVFVEPEGFVDEMLMSYAEGHHLEAVEVRLATGEDGAQRWWEYTSQPIPTGPYTGGRIESFFDVTQRRSDQGRLEEQLGQAQKMEAIGRLAGGVAHDFNNMLTAINGYSQLLSRLAPEGQQRTYVEEIRKAGKRAAEMTANLLRISRRQIVHPQVIGLKRLVRGHENLLQKMIGEDVRLKIRVAPHVGSLKVDPGQMEQVLLNLVINARDAMPTGGELVVAGRNVEFAHGRGEIPPGSYVCVEVIDTGTGIEPDIVERIFEPLFTTKEKGKGTGFGLAMVYATVTRFDGYIQVDSTPGQGTTVRIYLPRADEPPEDESQDELDEPLERGDERILLVEDEDAVRSLVRELLQKQGYTVLVAKNAREALEVIEENQGRIDLMVSDVVMPAMSGPELARQLMPRYPDMRILFISGYTDSFIMQHGLRRATQLVLQKPFDAHVLAEKVREVLDTPTGKD